MTKQPLVFTNQFYSAQ